MNILHIISNSTAFGMMARSAAMIVGGMDRRVFANVAEFGWRDSDDDNGFDGGPAG